jgi:transposase-like protein
MEVNLFDLIEQYHNDDDCRKALEALKWPNGVKCPRCGSEKVSSIKNRDQFYCDPCHYNFSVTAGTIFHDSHLPLSKWFFAVYLMCESKKGISANQLKRTLKISYKTAWYLCHRIRKAIEEIDPKPKLDGIVEVDETFVGGVYDPRRKREPWEKQAVVGLLQRKGRLEAKTIRTPSKKVLVGVCKERIDKNATIMTDERTAYQSLDETFRHEHVNHHNEEYVRGDVYTNGIENAFSLFKRSIVGAFHQISTKHMDAYLDEFEWKFNGRENPHLFSDTLTRLLNSPKMEFKELTSKAA